MLKLACVLGSPRETGNSAKIAEHLCAALRPRGVHVKTFFLNKLKYVGCQSCMGCKGKSEVCVIADDLAEVLSVVKDADIIVLASPVFYGDLSSQMKGFIDRTYSYLKPDYTTRLRPGKKAVMILSQGDSDRTHFADIFPRYNEFLKWYGIAESHLIRAFYSNDSKTTPLDEALREAEAVAAKLVPQTEAQ